MFALFPSATRIQYLPRLPAGANNPVNPVDPVEHIVSLFPGNGRAFSVLTGRTGGLFMI